MSLSCTLLTLQNKIQQFLLSFILCFILYGSNVGQTLFGPEEIIINGFSPNAAISVDVDGDGDADVVSSSQFDDKIAWYENEDGLGHFGSQQVISTNANGAWFVTASDLDGDGDMDIISASCYDNKIAWYENEDGLGNFSSQKIISQEADQCHVEVQAADIDGDGDMDILSATRTNITAWYENLDGAGTFGPQQIITTDTWIAESVYASDVDGDGDLDVLSASYVDNKIAWYENMDGLGSFGAQQIISEEANGATCVHTIDVDGDGDMDVVATTQNYFRVVWYENENGKGQFSDEKLIVLLPQSEFISSLDMDNDGDFDLLVAYGDGVAWIENEDGLGTFGGAQLITTEATNSRTVFSADIDGDGDPDVLSASEYDNKIAWYENENSVGTFGPQNIIYWQPVNRLGTIHSTDIDGDGDLDILSTDYNDNSLFWFDNKNGMGDFSLPKVISTEAGGIWSIDGADLDGDGDMDIITAASVDDKIAWYENLDGFGNFGSQQILTTSADGAISVHAADMDGDGDMDIAAASRLDSTVSWFKNEDGLGTFSSEQIISTNSYRVSSVKAADIDSDGDNDLLCAVYEHDEIVWFENSDGAGTFGFKKTISDQTDGALDAMATDVDGDGDLDVVSVSDLDDKIAWYENLDGLGNFGSQQVISNQTDRPKAISIADMDGDNDPDVVACFYSNASVSWFENSDNAGTFLPQQVISQNAEGVTYVLVADIDTDGHLDIVSSSVHDNKIAWYQNLRADPMITGSCFFDQNQNKIKDPDEFGLINHPVFIEPDALANFTNADGIFAFVVKNGDYTITAQPDANWQLTTDSNSYHVSIQDTTIQNLNFGLFPIQDISQVEPSIASAATRCGFQVPFWMNFENTGTNFATGYLSIQLDPLTSMLNSFPAPDSVEGNLLFWKFENLPPSANRKIDLNLQMPGVSNLGDTVTFLAATYINDMNDDPQLNTTYEYQSVINCAYDPNDKLVHPVGIQNEQYTLFGEELEFTVRFQNTGTDTAFNVRIEDQLDTDLDWMTFRPVAASHNYETTLHSNGLVEFLFPNILLPDSTTNEPASHGFVKYRIQHIENLTENTEITNTAGIFFDFNPPVITNTTLNTFVSEFPTAVSNLSDPVQIEVFPNPFHDFANIKVSGLPIDANTSLRLYNIYGQLLKSYAVKPPYIFQINGANLPAGGYFYELRNESGLLLSRGKLVKQ